MCWEGFSIRAGGQLAQVVRVVPVHPVAQSDGLFRLHGGKAQHPLLALAHEGVQAVGFDVALGAEAQLLLHLHLDPQSLAVETVLVAQFPTAHGPEAIEHVLVRPSPAVMYAERVVGRYRPVQKGPFRLPGTQGAQGLESAGVFPQPQHLVFLSGIVVNFGGDVLKRHESSSPGGEHSTRCARILKGGILR